MTRTNKASGLAMRVWGSLPQGVLALLLTVLGQGSPAAPMCVIDPVSHQVSQEIGQGGIGGTGAPGSRLNGPVLASNGNGGIGGTGMPLRVPLAGHVLFVHGSVVAERSDGNKRELAQGSAVCEGDTIDTQTASLVQLNMADNGQLEVRAQSRLSLDTFTLPDNMDGSERFSASLAWGSVRAVTGEIGHVHKELYALHTPLADIGVRGTSHEVFHVPIASAGVPVGTYNRVLSGKTVLSSAGSSLELLPSQAGFVAAKDVPPRRLDRLPPALAQPAALPLAFNWHSPSPQNAQGNVQSNVPSKVDEEAAGPVFLKPLQTVTRYYGWLPKGPEDSVYVGASQDLDNNVVRVGGVASNRRNGSVILLDPVWGLPSAAADTRNGFNFLTGNDTFLYDLGSAGVDGVTVVWGLYGNTADIDPVTGAVRPVDFHHFAFAPAGLTPMPTLKRLSGTVTFGKLVGGTMLTDESGGVGGQVNALSIDMQFGPQVWVTSYQLNATDSQSRNWNAQFNGRASLRDFRAGRLPLTAQCSGEGCGSGVGNGQASGAVIGKTGKGVITSFGLQTTSGQTVAGAAVVSRP
ncbi:FecR domain-containing protein [Crenobacter sp. SG2305]|uniref:FecR family protein n=1 Tax=Crenobacter oryzisoli TaxID=3056844 RepID=UPI0025AA3801|nr:FecR domain-containing protein [Crenobacter sp. SG2305]MDN0083219.1 FecR domain-containing protein [Crenobacter sp. SG2305]